MCVGKRLVRRTARHWDEYSFLPGLTSLYHPKYLSLYRDLGQFIVAQGWEAAVFAGRGQLGIGRTLYLLERGGGRISRPACLG